MDAKSRVILLSIFTILFISVLAFAAPTGPDAIESVSNSTYSGSAIGSMFNISGGYISTINISATTQNDNWKAFIGNVTGSFTLDDASGATIYDWTLSTIGGEIFATRDSGTIEWGNIGCATGPEIIAEDTVLHHTGEDNISSTFTGVTVDQEYTVAGTALGVCAATNTYVDNASQSSTFDEFILHDDTSIIFASNIEEDSPDYSGGATYDFQMIVPENGSQTWTSSIAYYLYVELN